MLSKKDLLKQIIGKKISITCDEGGGINIYANTLESSNVTYDKICAIGEDMFEVEKYWASQKQPNVYYSISAVRLISSDI